MTMAEYTYWRIHRGRVLTTILYLNRLGRLFVRWAYYVPRNMIGGNREGALKAELRLTAARLGWHVKHGGDILVRAPRAYRG
ncbi:MAG: hypothetical protein ABFD96_14060, partial [Armatimonadia bacterium]